MNERSDIERVLRDWFDDGPTVMPDRVAFVVANRIDRQRQRRPWRLRRRLQFMNTWLKIGAGVAAVVLIAVITLNVLPGLYGGAGGPTTTAAPAVTPSPSPTPTAIPPIGLMASPPTYAWPLPLAPGTYTTSFLWQLPFELSFTVPDGWSSRDVEIIRDPVISLGVHLVGNTYADPCDSVLRDPPLGPGVDDLAEALAGLPDVDATSPVPVQFDRNTTGRYVEFDVPAEACGGGAFRLWHDPDGVYRPAVPKGPPEWTAERSHNRVWILDVDGVRLVISALSSLEATAADLAELQAVVDSVRIVRAGSTPPPGPASPAP